MATHFIDLIHQVAQVNEGEYTAQVTNDWLQGRTTFGGLSAALAYRAVQLHLGQHLPLRGVSVQFMGPVGEGEVSIKVDTLRQGKSVTFIQAVLTQNDRAGLMIQAALGAGRDSMIGVDAPVLADVPPVEQSFMLPKEFDGKPKFTSHFDMAWAVGTGPMTGHDSPKCGCWVRLDEPHAIDEPYLIALMDILPPAVVQMFTKPAPISTLTWHMTPLTDIAASGFKQGDWWYVELDSDGCKEGYSQQVATLYHESGVAVATSHQSVAIFA